MMALPETMMEQTMMDLKKEIDALFEKKEIDADDYEMRKNIIEAFVIVANIENSTKKFTEEQHQNLCTDDEVNKVMEDMQTTIKEIEESEYYRHMIQHLQKDEKIRNSILGALGSGRGDHNGGHKEEEEEHGCRGRLQMWLYGVGSIQFNYNSQYQLSLAIMLTRDLSHWIEATIEFFDPYLTPVDVKVMEALGCKVLDKKERYPIVERPTLFFMPGVWIKALDDLLIANWCPSRLNQMVFFGGSFCQGVSVLGDLLDRDKCNLMKNTILNHSIAFKCDEDFKTGLPFFSKCMEGSPFFEHHWLFINLPMSDSNYQLEAMLPADVLERMKIICSDHIHGMELEEFTSYLNKASLCLDIFLRHDEALAFEMENNPLKIKDWSMRTAQERYPTRSAKRNWCPPSNGWIKLNFSAVAVAVAVAGSYKIVELGYGGIFHDENKECLLSYSCPLLNKDNEEEEEGEAVAVNDLDFAYARALKEGLRLYMDLRSTTTLMDDKQKLVIEGDSISIVRLVNGIFPPPKRLVGIVEEIQDLMSGIADEHVLFHIYKEANSTAIDLANQGARGIIQ